MNKIHSLSLFFTLADVNECSRSLDNCHTNATCQNNVGSFTCACNVGHEGDGVDCDGKLLYLLINREWGLYRNYQTVPFGSIDGAVARSLLQGRSLIFPQRPNDRENKNALLRTSDSICA